ncbi:metal ABC transporter solute-binding protein, Zn/Mn family [uncultured Tissierella sp.]|uniref:metal ABC transporter solute-binding protein, Zn/Mn family n=1 Tax=uncultured Tissierella sp. TaxID=448160 RepID=UPI00280509E9|nr:zinc ABC transporter substrate-binding protein [uncultured Tissierella sp.]MDU5082126.1 zinc ABC transporter substrate-binding protein [Bacillota bacterium]
MVKGKRIWKTFIISLVILLMSGCSKNTDHEEINSGRLKIITTLFPQYDFVKEIGKDKVDVNLLLPPGVESHSYEPTPKDMVDIKNADIFIYTGEYMEPWAKKIADNIEGYNLIITDASEGVELLEGHGHEEDEHEGHENEEDENEDHAHDHSDKDPHIWLDPMYAQKMIDNITVALTKADKENKEFYIKNAEEYKKQLDLLDKEIAEALEKVNSKKVIYGGHSAFSYFARRYNLEFITPYNGFSPNAEPTPKMIIELIKNIEDAGVKSIFYEELIDPKVAKIISSETGAKMILLHGAHNLSKEEIESDVRYIDIMKGNLERLKEGLGYEE